MAARVLLSKAGLTAPSTTAHPWLRTASNTSANQLADLQFTRNISDFSTPADVWRYCQPYTGFAITIPVVKHPQLAAHTADKGIGQLVRIPSRVGRFDARILITSLPVESIVGFRVANAVFGAARAKPHSV